MDTYRHISPTRQADVLCVRLTHTRLEELEIQQLGEEILAASEASGCRTLALSLGPGTPYCLYSVFLAKLVALRNALRKKGVKLVLCDVGPHAYGAFEACHLAQEFEFVSDFAAALEMSRSAV